MEKIRSQGKTGKTQKAWKIGGGLGKVGQAVKIVKSW